MTQGRRYNSATKLTRATSFPKLPPVKDVSDRCVLGLANELRCWGDVFDDTERFSYEPVQVGHCGVTQLISGPGRCFVDANGLACLDWQAFEGDVWHNGVFRAGYEAKRFAGSDTQVCAVDTNSQLACSRYESFNLLPVLGRTAGQLLMTDTRTPACPVDAAPTTLPSFPPVLPASVTVSASTDTLLRLHVKPEVKRLSAGQVTRLLRLLNQRDNYTNISTCHDPQFDFILRDARGEVQAEVSVGTCPTLESGPEIPAQHGKGNVIDGKLSVGLRQICRETGLKVCDEDPP